MCTCFDMLNKDDFEDLEALTGFHGVQDSYNHCGQVLHNGLSTWCMPWIIWDLVAQGSFKVNTWKDCTKRKVLKHPTILPSVFPKTEAQVSTPYAEISLWYHAAKFASCIFKNIFAFNHPDKIINSNTLFLDNCRFLPQSDTFPVISYYFFPIY